MVSLRLQRAQAVYRTVTRDMGGFYCRKLEWTRTASKSCTGGMLSGRPSRVPLLKYLWQIRSIMDGEKIRIAVDYLRVTALRTQMNNAVPLLDGSIYVKHSPYVYFRWTRWSIAKKKLEYIPMIVGFLWRLPN